MFQKELTRLLIITLTRHHHPPRPHTAKHAPDCGGAMTTDMV